MLLNALAEFVSVVQEITCVVDERYMSEVQAGCTSYPHRWARELSRASSQGLTEAVACTGARRRAMMETCVPVAFRGTYGPLCT
jgi:hypothetical protein